eukprot:g9096.t1
MDIAPETPKMQTTGDGTPKMQQAAGAETTEPGSSLRILTVLDPTSSRPGADKDKEPSAPTAGDAAEGFNALELRCGLFGSDLELLDANECPEKLGCSRSAVVWAKGQVPGNLELELQLHELPPLLEHLVLATVGRTGSQGGSLYLSISAGRFHHQYKRTQFPERGQSTLVQGSMLAVLSKMPKGWLLQEVEAIQDLTTSVTLRRDLARTTPLFREALRLSVPDSWDSEEEEKTGRKRPDVSKLASCWEILEKDMGRAMGH